MNWSWVKRRWWDFRVGHGAYLAFFLSFTNFLLIAYNFFVLQFSFLKSLFGNLLVFGLVGLLVYIPLAVYVGHLHKVKQLATDATVNFQVILDRLDIIENKLNGGSCNNG